MSAAPGLFSVLLMLAVVAGRVHGQTIAAALDTTGLTWNNPAGTLVENDVTFDGVDAVRLARTGSTPLSTTLTGPARLAFKVRTSTEANADWFEASVGGLVVDRLSGEQTWQTMVLNIPAGSQRVDLYYRKDAMTAHGADSVWVDAVEVLSPDSISIAEAVDANFPGEITVTTEAAGWFTVRKTPLSVAQPGDVLVLAPSPAGATTAAARLRLPVTGRGRLSVALNFIGTGTPTYVTPEFPLRWLSYTTPALTVGSYATLEFIQPLDAPLPAAEFVIPIPANMVALVDELRWTPLTSVSVGAALESESLPWRSAGGVLPVLTATDSYDGEDAVLFFDTGAAVSLPMTGPAYLTWVSQHDPAFTVDAGIRAGTARAALPDGWTRHAYLVPPGSHTLQWQTKGTLTTAFNEHGRLDSLTMTPLTTVSIPEAADAPGLTWTTAPDTTLGGVGGGSDTVQDGDAVRCIAFQPANDWVEAAGDGAGRLQFAWGGVMTLALDGVNLLSGPYAGNDWTYGVIEVPAGAWAARWTTAYDSLLMPGLDAVTFTAGAHETLSSIADCTPGVRVVAAHATRFAGPVSGWARAPGRQLLIEGNPAFTVETTGGGVLLLRLWANSGTVVSWGSGSATLAGGWQNLEISPATAGAGQTVRTNVVANATEVAVDSITWSTGSVFTAEEALDTPGVTWEESHTGSTGGWLGRVAPLPADNPGDGDAMVVLALAIGATADLSATLTGSGWLTFARNVPAGVNFTVLDNGTQLFAGLTTTTWKREYVELQGTGPHLVTFHVNRTSGTSGQVSLNDVGLAPWAEVSGGDAAEVPAGIPLHTSPWRRFRANRASYHQGRPEIVAAVPATDPAILECEVNGPAWLTCDALGSRLLFDGTLVRTLTSSSWTPVLLTLTPGPHKIRVVADSGVEGALDKFSMQPASAANAGEALDQPGWTWTAEGPWSASVPGALAHDGVDALAFTGPGNSAGSIRTPWPGAGLLSFWWKRTSSAGTAPPPLAFAGDTAWESQEVWNAWHRDFFELSAAGSTELVWSVNKGSQYGSDSRVFLDEVRLQHYSSASFAEALETPGRTWTTGTPPWQTLDDGPAPGDSADYAICPPVEGLRFLETAVTHPAWVEYDTVAAGMVEVDIEPAGIALQNNLIQPDQAGTAPGWVRRRVITGGSGAGALRFSGIDPAPLFQARLLDRVFIGESVSATEALDSPVPWENSYANDGAGFRLNRPLVDGDAVVVQLKAYAGELSTTLTGPGEFALRWQTEWDGSPLPGVVAARVFLDGAVVQEITSATGWNEVRHRVPAGSHRLSLVNVRLAGGMLFLDDFRFTPGGADEVSLALDLPGSFASAGSAWSTLTDATATGGTALRSPENAASGTVQTAALAFDGAGSLGFSYQFQAAEGAAFSLLLDGETFWTASPAAAWTTASLPVPNAGEHTLTLQWQQGDAGGFALMDALTLTPFAAVSVEEALDAPGQTWETKRCDGVAGAAAGTINGDALRMTADPAWNEDARLFTTVTGPARVSFRWYRGAARGDPGSGSPSLSFSAQGFCSFFAAKVQQWEQVSLDVPAGTFTLEWQAYATGTPLSVLVDDFHVTPVTLPLTLAAALDVPAGVTVTGNTNAWRTVTAPSVQGDDAVLGTDFTAPLTLTFSGSGEFEFTCSLRPDSEPAVGVSGTFPPVVQTVWRRPGALFGLDLGRFRIPFAQSGSRTVSFYSVSNAGISLFDDVVWRPVAAALTLEDVLDTPGRTWTTVNNPPWRPLPFRPSGTDAADVAWLSGGATPAMETTITGPHAVSLTGVEGGTVKALVNDTETGGSLGADIVYLLLPGTQTLRLMPGSSVSGGGLSIDSAVITPNPPVPAWLAGEGVTVTPGPGLWRSQPAGSAVPAPALLAFTSGSTAPSLAAQVHGAGALEFYANGGSVAVDGVLQVALTANGTWQRHRLELPAAGPHTITFSFTAGGLADLRWTPGAPVLSAVLGLSGPALFAPSDRITVLPGGGVCVDVLSGSTGLIAVESNVPGLYTWWQQAATTIQVKSPGATNLFAPGSSTEAGPPPPPANGVPWSPRRMVWTVSPYPMTWLLTGAVCVGNIRSTAQPVPLAEALDLPPGVTVTALAPGSAAGYALAPAAGGDIVGLRTGYERALELTASGPGILTYDTSGGSLRITVGTLPPVDVFNGRGHVLLAPGTQTVAFGNRPGATAVALLDNVSLLPLPWDPVAAIGGAQPLVVGSGSEPATWPFVTSGGDGGMSFPGTELYTASGGPARISFRSTSGAVTGMTNYITPPAQLEQLWPVGTQSLWLDRAASVRIFSGYAGLQTSVDNVRLDAAPEVTFPQALDADSLTFTASAGVLAHALPQGAVFDGDAAAFAPGTVPRTLQTTVTGPGRLRFWWRSLTPQANAIICRIGGGTAVSQDTALWKQADLAVPAGVQSVVWTVAANLSSAELDRVEFFPQWNFSTWAAQNALAGLPTNAVRAADDSDHDGAAGLLEYAFGLDPGATDFAIFPGSLTGPESARGLPVLRVARGLDGRDYLEFQFPRRLNSGLAWQMEAAADPADPWLGTGALEVLRPLGAEWELCRTRDTLPLDPARPRRVVRLRVTQP